MSLSKLERNLIDFLSENEGHPYKTKDIAAVFNYGGSKNYKKLIKALAFLERVGEIQVNDRGEFLVPANRNQLTGTYRGNDRGFGFISYDPDEADLFVPKGKNGGAMNGDTVEVRILKHVDSATGKGSECEVIRIVDRASTQVVGEFVHYDAQQRGRSGYLGYLIPQGTFSAETKIYILPEGVHPADQSLCVVKIKDYPSAQRPEVMTGYVVKEIGHKNEPGADILAILYKFNIPHEFPEEVLAEANQVPQEVDSADYQGRRDLRELLTITIDGADAKDLDDAISIEVLSEEVSRLYVHIADVAHYVRRGTAMDAEAYERGNSVYLTDRVVPMLPPRLSNGICSLNPYEDRLTITCEMEINRAGHVLRHDIYLSVINSDYRMTYDQVNRLLDGEEELTAEYAAILPEVQAMADLHHQLEAMRIKRGALNLDAPESYIIVDEEGHPIDIELRERKTSERMIESFMLVANETVAADYEARQLPFIYRIHESPTEERITRFAEFITAFGLVLRGQADNIHPRQMQEILTAVEDEPYQQVVSMMLLRSMQQAKYSDEPKGHYGLSTQDYTHFTAPIRRYSDLLAHRLIHTYLKGRPEKKVVDYYDKHLEEIADHVSHCERRAVDAERETDSMKKAEYMLERVGQVYDGVISSVTSFGMFVQLPNTVEGLVSLRDLDDDYYEFDQQRLILIGERTKKIYQIGQGVQVEVANVDVDEREIDFRLLDAESVKADDLPDHGAKASQSGSKAGKRGGKKGSADRSQRRSKGKGKRQSGGQQAADKRSHSKQGSQRKSKSKSSAVNKKFKIKSRRQNKGQQSQGRRGKK